MRTMAWTKIKIATALLGAAALGGGLAAAREPSSTPAAVPAGARDILTEEGYWRWHVTYDKPTYKEGGQEKPLKRKLKWGQRRRVDLLESPPPPEYWMKSDFDDSDWPRSRPRWFRWLAFGRFSTSQVSLRGRFAVTNPAGANLYLSAKYIGGAVVHLNGKEVHRTDMPKGKVTPKTWANPYAEKYYRDSSGNLFSMYGGNNAQKHTEMRMRTMAPVRLPSAALRRGVNVLAVEIHRSPYPALATKWVSSQEAIKKCPWWPHADLAEIRLKSAGAGAVPNVSRPRGVQIWNHDRNDRVTVMDYGDPNEKLRPVKIVGARNGSFCGQVVVSSDQALRGVRVTPRALKAVKGGGSIPAGNVTAIYGLMDWRARYYEAWCDALQEKPPAQVAVHSKGRGAVLPVLFRVKVPGDAKPGEYRGSIAVLAGGRSVTVPVHLSVADWTVPDPRDYRTYMGIYQSPTSLAMKYKVEFWSEEHWKLIDKSFALLGRAGNKMVDVPVVDETQFGNPEGMIYWVKKADGRYEYDFRIFDRYMKMVLGRCGPQDYVCLQIWHAGGWSHRKVDNRCTVQVIDKKTGKREPVQVPLWGKPEATAFWKPFLARAQARLVKMGMPKAMTVGILSCSTAPNEVFKTMSEVFPGGQARWHRGCHVSTEAKEPYRVSKVGNNVVSLHEHCYGMSMVSPDVEKLPPIHTFRGKPATAYFRISGHESATTLISYRTMPERGLWCQKQGIGRICMDFWDVLKGKRGRATHIYNRYPHSSCAQRQPTLKKMVWAGPQGPETTVRYEALCEGMQESEAMMVLSEAAAREARVGRNLADRCRKALRDHLWYCHTRNQHRWANSYVHMNHHGWQDLARRTFELAGEVSKKLGRYR